MDNGDEMKRGMRQRKRKKKAERKERKEKNKYLSRADMAHPFHSLSLSGETGAFLSDHFYISFPPRLYVRASSRPLAAFLFFVSFGFHFFFLSCSIFWVLRLLAWLRVVREDQWRDHSGSSALVVVGGDGWMDAVDGG